MCYLLMQNTWGDELKSGSDRAALQYSALPLPPIEQITQQNLWLEHSSVAYCIRIFFSLLIQRRQISPLEKHILIFKFVGETTSC